MSQFCVYRPQFLLDGLGRYFNMFVSSIIPLLHVFASHVCLTLFIRGKYQHLEHNNECLVDRQRHFEAATT